MPREKRRHHRAAPEGPRHSFERQKQERRIGGVQQHVDDVRRAGPQPEELTVQHVRHPGQRVPVARITGLKAPAQSRPGEAAFDVVVDQDVKIVVEVGEVEPRHRPIKQRYARRQNRAHQCVAPSRPERDGSAVGLRSSHDRAGAPGKIFPGPDCGPPRWFPRGPAPPRAPFAPTPAPRQTAPLPRRPPPAFRS